METADPWEPRAGSAVHESPQQWLRSGGAMHTFPSKLVFGRCDFVIGRGVSTMCGLGGTCGIGNTHLSVKNPRQRRWSSDPGVCVRVHVFERTCLVHSVTSLSAAACVSVEGGENPCLHNGGGSTLVDSLLISSQPNIFLKDAPSTKFGSKPMICTQHSLLNHDVFSLGMHT